MRIDLDLSRHCIATEVKRRYEASMRAYWKASQGREVLEQEIEALRVFLEHGDLAGLRSREPRLDQGSSSQVFLDVRPCERLWLEVDGEVVLELDLKGPGQS
jgi:hypothetical protein